MSHTLEMDSRHRYKCVNPEHKDAECAGKIFQSVTTILGNAVPKNLAWYGMTQGVYGVKGLTRIPKYDVRQMKAGDIRAVCLAEGILEHGHAPNEITPAHRTKISAVPKYDVARMSPADITEALKREKLTVNDHRDAAAEGGTIVHKALEDYANKGTIPSASAVPESKRASIRGLAKFIIDFKPEFVATEVKTLSVRHGFAGTFDLLCKIRVGEIKDGRIIPSPDAPQRLGLIDMKTSKWIYPSSHFPQLEAYEGARLEAGEEPTDFRAVLWVNGDGDMQLVHSTATFDDFLALKASADVIGRLEKSWKRPRKARR